MSYIAAIDQGTTSSRCIVFDASGGIVSVAQREHRQIFPRPGWVEHDAEEIWAAVQQVVGEAVAGREITAVGITNQRETTLVWDRATGRPVANAIVWQDTRTDEQLRRFDAVFGEKAFKRRTGLPLAPYFAASKLAWLLDHVDGLRVRAERGEVLFGTMDSWLIWKLTGRHLTDVTNASRTLLMNLETLDWDPEILAAVGIPAAMLPAVRSSAEVYGEVTAGPLAGVPLASALGDQQAALFGQTCFRPGGAKCTYGTGSFLLLNTGTEPVTSQHGLLTTVGYRIGDHPAVYALEGSIAVTGSLIQWLRDNLGLIRTAAEVEELARSVPDNGGCYLVPAFSGLFAPHWRRRPRRAGRPHRLREPRAPGPRRTGGDRLADPRGGRRDERGRRHPADPASGGRRDDPQRPAHAVPRRHAAGSGGAADGRRDDLPRCRLRGGPGGRLLA